jgi:hypothetical protein
MEIRGGGGRERKGLPIVPDSQQWSCEGWQSLDWPGSVHMDPGKELGEQIGGLVLH